MQHVYQPPSTRASYDDVPERPWQKFGCDIFTLDEKDYLCTVDYYSGYFEIDHLERKTARAIITRLKRPSQQVSADLSTPPSSPTVPAPAPVEDPPAGVAAATRSRRQIKLPTRFRTLR